MIYIIDKSLKKLPYISTVKARSFTATFGNSTFILNESSKHPNLTLKASSTSSISYSSNQPKHLINLDLSGFSAFLISAAFVAFLQKTLVC